jgi:hypothetical protein
MDECVRTSLQDTRFVLTGTRRGGIGLCEGVFADSKPAWHFGFANYRS